MNLIKRFISWLVELFRQKPKHHKKLEKNIEELENKLEEIDDEKMDLNDINDHFNK